MRTGARRLAGSVQKISASEKRDERITGGYVLRPPAKPDCWCAPPHGGWYQCDGDADGADSGFPFEYRCSTGDLALIVNNWKKKIDDPTLNPCADIDHKDSGHPFHYRVYTSDLARLLKCWEKERRGEGLPRDCPRPE